MPTIDSRQGPGKLTIGTAAPDLIEVAPQASTVKLTPTVNSADGTPTLETPTPAPETDVTWSLNVSAIQDFEDPVGFVNFLMDHALAELAFVWLPIDDGGAPGATVSYAGTLQVVPIEIGGDVAVQTITDVELPLVGQPVRTDPAAARSSSSSKADKP
jgi:hypothetical protein